MVRFRIPRAGFGHSPPSFSDVSELSVDRMINDFLHAIEAFNRLGSQWKVDYIIDFSVTLAPYRPAQGFSYIPTPTHIAAKKLCFLYSILAHMNMKEIRPTCVTIDLISPNSPLPV